MKNFGQILRITFPKVSMSNVLDNTGAIMATWNMMIPEIEPGR